MKVKKYLILIIILIISGISIYLFYFSDECNKFSSFHSYAWGDKSEKCINAGCDIIKLEEVDDPNLWDDEGYYFKCVSK